MSTRAGLPLVKSFEQCRLEAFIPVQGDPWTLGWGRTHNVQEGDTCTQGEADQWLIQDYDEREREVLNVVSVDLTENQLGALTSFVYNVGMGAEGVKDGLAHLKSGGQSHLLIYTNMGQFNKAADQFMSWDKAHGQVLQGLYNRRKAERELFLA